MIIEFLMRYLPLIIAAVCAFLLGLWFLFLKKEDRREFLNKIGILIIVTLLSFSVALFCVSVSAKWQVKRETKVTVVRIFAVHHEASKNRNRIGQLIDDHLKGEVKNIQLYMLDITHADGFVGCDSYYGCPAKIRRMLEKVRRLLKDLNISLRESRDEIDATLAGRLRKCEKLLGRCMEELERIGTKMNEPVWRKELEASREEDLVK